MKYMICKPIGSVARLFEGRVFYTPLMTNHTFNTTVDDWSECETFQSDEPLNKDGYATLGEYNQHVLEVLNA